ncbi:MAG: hypothetical protein WB562_18615 [Candidatus Sulfotelmatobacter sp.]
MKSSTTGELGRPHRPSSSKGGVGLHQKQGIWVFGVGEPIPAGATDETLRQIRRQRDLSFMGNLPTRRPRRKKSR